MALIFKLATIFNVAYDDCAIVKINPHVIANDEIHA